MNRQLSGGVIAGIVVVLILIVAGLWTVKGRQDKQAAMDRRAIILSGAGGEHPPTTK